MAWNELYAIASKGNLLTLWLKETYLIIINYLNKCVIKNM